MHCSTFIHKALILQSTLDRNFPIHVFERGKKPREIKIHITAIRRKHGSMYFAIKNTCVGNVKKFDSMLSGEIRKHYSENKIECCLMKRSKKRKRKCASSRDKNITHPTKPKKLSFFC